MRKIVSRLWEALTSTPGPVYCPRCGHANDASANYCGGCGMKL